MILIPGDGFLSNEIAHVLEWNKESHLSQVFHEILHSSEAYQNNQ